MTALDSFLEKEQPVIINVLGLDIAFRAGADMERARVAASLVEKRYEDQKQKSRGGQTKDILLTFVALGLADELLQMKIKQGATRERLEALLAKIEKSI